MRSVETHIARPHKFIAEAHASNAGGTADRACFDMHAISELVLSVEANGKHERDIRGKGGAHTLDG